MISAAMGDTKAGNIEASGAEYVASCDGSCLMHIEGILRKRGASVKTIHLASILASAPALGKPPASRQQEEVTQ